MSETFWASLGSLVTGAGLVFSIFKYYADKRDKDHADERSKFYKDLYDFEDRMEAEIRALKIKIDQNFILTNETRLTIEVQKEKFSSMTDKFTDYAVVVRHTLERHTEELAELGKIIRLGDK